MELWLLPSFSFMSELHKVQLDQFSSTNETAGNTYPLGGIRENSLIDKYL
jgi:hypothetical protein